MPRVKIFYQPDDTCGHAPFPYTKQRPDYGSYRDPLNNYSTPNSNPIYGQNNAADLAKNLVNLRPATTEDKSADEYLKILKPVKSKGRMEVKADVPKTLTPRGYAKLKLMMSISDKQYQTLSKQLKRNGQMWRDPDFPADDSSIGTPGLRGQIEWRRPKELAENAQFFVGDVNRFDIEQGALGDCWLLAVIASISLYPDMFNQVVPRDQDIRSPDYVGIFRARFWRFGQWVEVLVDDRLPVRRGTNQLIFMRSKDRNEFWSALLEKAYAKLNGCYENLVGGAQSEAMEDVTGGLCESIELSRDKRPPDLRQHMLMFTKRCVLMGSSVSNDGEAYLSNGLIAGHAYSVTGVQTCNYRGKEQYLVRCRNPWGGKHEWRGAWSDNSNEWNQISPAERKALALQFGEDGEFWMSFEDFVESFSKLEVCHLGLESLEEDTRIQAKRRLEEVVYVGSWQKGVSAGGCLNYRETFHTNPQFLLTVTDPDPDDEDEMCMIVIGLMQKDMRKNLGGDFLTIGFVVYQVPETQTGLLDRRFIMTNSSKVRSTFANSREITERVKLKPGKYVIIPSTFEPGEEATFIVRVLSQVAVEDRELDEDNQDGGLPGDVVEAIALEDMVLSEDEVVEEHFKRLCNKKTYSINAVNLMEILNSTSIREMENFNGFNLEMARSMIALADHNLTGNMELPELKECWANLKGWKHIFLKHDINGNGSFTSTELRDALNDAGYRLSNRVFDAVVHRYTHPQKGAILYEDFLLCVLRLKTAFETSAAHPRNAKGATVFSDEDYLRFAVYI